MATALQFPPNHAMKGVLLLDGDAGIRQTIKAMQKLVSGPKGIGSGLVRATALQIARGSVRNITEIKAVFDWVKQNIDFRGEAEETLQSPEATLNMGAGDCDDHAMLLAALLGSLGYEWGLKTVAVARESPTEYSHVYAVVRDKVTGNWTAVDTTVKKSSPGWEPDDITRQEMYTTRSMGGLRGLRRLGDDATTIYTDLAAPVPIPVAPSGISGNQALLYNLLAPLDEAGASLIAHGQTPAASANLNVNGLGLGAGLSSNFPWLLLAAGAALWFVFMKR